MVKWCEHLEDHSGEIHPIYKNKNWGFVKGVYQDLEGWKLCPLCKTERPNKINTAMDMGLKTFKVTAHIFVAANDEEQAKDIACDLIKKPPQEHTYGFHIKKECEKVEKVSDKVWVDMGPAGIFY